MEGWAATVMMSVLPSTMGARLHHRRDRQVVQVDEVIVNVVVAATTVTIATSKRLRDGC